MIDREEDNYICKQVAHKKKRKFVDFLRNLYRLAGRIVLRNKA